MTVPVFAFIGKGDVLGFVLLLGFVRRDREQPQPSNWARIFERTGSSIKLDLSNWSFVNIRIITQKVTHDHGPNKRPPMGQAKKSL